MTDIDAALRETLEKAVTEFAMFWRNDSKWPDDLKAINGEAMFAAESAFKAELAKRGLSIVKLPEARGRPTIEELEKILTDDTECRIEMQPNGEVRAVPVAPADAQVTDALADQMAAEEAAECTAEAELDAQVDGYVEPETCTGPDGKPIRVFGGSYEPLTCDMCEAVIPEKDGGGFEPHVCGMPCVDCGKDASALGWSWITDTDVICHPCRDGREAEKNPKAGAAIAKAWAYDR